MSARNRVKSVVEETWGKSIIFGLEKNSTSFSNVESLISIDAGVSPCILSFQYFQALLYATVLEDTISETRLLEECNNELRIMKTLFDMDILRATKYNILQPPKDELDGINPKDLSKNEYKLNKLASDRKYLHETLLVVYLDATLKQSFRTLVDSNMKIVDTRNRQVFLLEDEAKNRVMFRELTRQLRLQRNHIKSVTYDTDMVIEGLKREVEDAVLNAEIRFRYVNNWQGARSEQNFQTIKDIESRPLFSIEYFKQRTDHEQRVHQEVDLIINIAINEKLQQVESWMNKYDKDMERMDLNIQILKNDHTNKLEYRIQLENTFAKRDTLMKDWQHFKNEREKARLYLEKMHSAAMTVQAWWRGLLVRKQLGPYKPTKRPPPPPKEDKKKKKK